MDEWDLEPPSQDKTSPSEAARGPEKTSARRAGTAEPSAPQAGARNADTSRSGARPKAAPMDEAIIMEPARGAGGPAANANVGADGAGTPGASEPLATPGTGAAGASTPVVSELGGKKTRPGSKRRGGLPLPAWLAAAVALLAVGVVIGFAIARSQNADIAADLDRVRQELGVVEKALSQAEERNWNYYRENQSLKAQLEAGQPGGTASTTLGSAPGTTSTTLAPGPGVTYGDGIYLVGEDIAPGTYDGVVTGEQGYWARLKGTDGQVSSIIANAIPREPFVLTITVSDKAVELRGVEITAR